MAAADHAWRRHLHPLAVFAVCFVVYNASSSMVQTDSIWTIPVAASILHDGDTNLDEFRGTNPRGYLIQEVGGHDYAFFPLATSVAAIPGVLVLEGLAHLLHRPTGPLARFEKQFHATGTLDLGSFNFAERFIASSYVALAMALLYLAARRRLGARMSWLAVLTTAFGTSAWSTSSRVLWQHGPSLCAVAAVLYLIAAPQTPARRHVLLLGALAAAAYTLRPTNALTALAVAVWVAARHPRWLGYYVLGGALIGLPFVLFNWSVYGGPLPPYFEAGRLGTDAGTLLTALAGNLISPARGLFVWSPLFAWVALLGLAAVLRRRVQPLDLLAAAVLVAHWLVISTFPHWWGGHSIGPRLFADVLPYWAWGTIRLTEHFSRGVPKAYWAVAGLLLAWAVFANGHGATSVKVHFWNSGPHDVDEDPSRLWDWGHPQFLAGF